MASPNTTKPPAPVRLEIRGLSYTVKNKGKIKPLLQNVYAVFPPRKLIAIVGGSGAGKSTLLKAMTGMLLPSSGSINLNGSNFYKDKKSLSALVGYVPQDDAIHSELCVYDVLNYAAQLRTSSNIHPDLVKHLVESTLKKVDLSHRADLPVSRLSGGQKKRVNVAVEILKSPSILLLDEPTSGLDPGLEWEFIDIFQKLKLDSTVVIVTHSEAIINSADYLLVMGAGGRVTFFGTPEECLTFFVVNEYRDVFSEVSKEESSKPLEFPKRKGAIKWANKYNNSLYFTNHVATQLSEMAGDDKPPVRKNAWDKLEVLTSRYWKTLIGTSIDWKDFRSFYSTRDYWKELFKEKRTLLFLLMQTPGIAVMLSFVFRPDIFDSQFQPDKCAVLLFSVVFSAIVFGIVNASQEFTKETTIHRRESLLNISSSVYLLSKLIILFRVCVLQTACLLGVIQYRTHFLDSKYTIFSAFIILLAAMFCGILLGLVISAKADDNDEALRWILFAVVVQYVFSGLIQIDKFGFLSTITPSYWAYSAIGNLAKLPHASDNHFDISPHRALFALGYTGLGYGLLCLWLLYRKEKRLA